MKRVLTISVARLAAIALTGLVALAGCGGGADTATNPVTSGPSAGASYSGPDPMTADIQSFRVNFWNNVRGANRCGNCHNAGGQAPNFARSDDVNAAYQQAGGVVDRNSPSQSRIVTKVGGGHNCWLADAGACANILTRWISDWVGEDGGGVKQIELIAPTAKDPGASKRFPTPRPAEFDALHAGVLEPYCSSCHSPDAATPQSPYFASSNLDDAYAAAIPKINLDKPDQSRFVIRLRAESHNCWSTCTRPDVTPGVPNDDADVMQAAIKAMADEIDADPINPNLTVSKALKMYDGTIASGGSRYDKNVIALYEFQTGQGLTAFDTSGVDPAADLNIIGDFEWVGGWGIAFKTGMAKAQATATSSRKLHQLITATGEYSIEAWVTPGNVTQEDARIISYSGSKTARNFTLSQTLYNYNAFGRSTATGTNGTPALSTRDADRRLQASLQHVVMTFDPVNGRRIYVNGEFTGDMDSGGGTLGDWDSSFAFVLGNEVSNDRPWTGVVRLVAIHNRALTAPQIKQNFEAGVGEKFFLLFGVEHLINVPKSYVMFEVTQYDSSGYLFTNPKFISLDAAAMPGSIPIEGIRIGLNGVEPPVGQAYRLLNTTITDANYSAATGQTLSTVGTIIGLERGPASDEFFLCFDRLGSRSNVCSEYVDAQMVNPLAVDRPSDIGVRTFDGINASLASMTGISPNTPTVKTAYNNVRQSLPAVVDINAFLSSHQTSIAQLAITYCAALVNDSAASANYFPGLNFSGNIVAQKNLLVGPLVARAVGTNVSSQPVADATTQLNTLVDTLCSGANATACANGTRTPTVAKAVCGAAMGSATMLVR